jgi:hypothetical protein
MKFYPVDREIVGIMTELRKNEMRYAQEQEKLREKAGQKFLVVLHKVLEERLEKMTTEEIEEQKKTLGSGNALALKVWEETGWLGDTQDAEMKTFRDEARAVLMGYLHELEALAKRFGRREEDEDE